MFQRELLSVYFVAGTQDCLHLSTGTPEQKLLSTLETALQAGITCYQFREKGELALQDKQAQWQLARDCQALCRQYGVPFVLNNDVEMAVKLGADGVHIGQKDMAALEAIKLIQGKLFLGISNSTLYELQNSLKLPDIDYWAVGRFLTRHLNPMRCKMWGLI